MATFKFSENRLYDFMKIIGQINEKLLQGSTQLDEDILLDDNDVMKFLRISRSTLFNYRKAKKITYFKLKGKNYYFKHQLIGDLLRLNDEQNDCPSTGSG